MTETEAQEAMVNGKQVLYRRVANDYQGIITGATNGRFVFSGRKVGGTEELWIIIHPSELSPVSSEE